MSSFGEELKRERELRQITLREISEATKINLRYLDALEHNDFKHLPGGVFNKGFVRAYAQFIGVDSETMVNAYLLEERNQEARGRQQKGEALGRPGHRTADPGRDGRARPERAGSSAWRVVSVLLLLVAAGVLAGLVMLWLKRGRDAPFRPTSGAILRSTGRVEADA